MADLPVAAPDPAADMYAITHVLHRAYDGAATTEKSLAFDALDALEFERDALLAERQQDKEELRRIAVMANELARDGLMPKGTAVKIRDVALAALGVRGDDAIQVLRGAALAVEEDATE